MRKADSADTIRATHGAYVVILGLLVVLAAFLAALIAFSSDAG